MRTILISTVAAVLVVTLTSTAQPVPCCVPPPPGMSAWWTFDGTPTPSSSDRAGFDNVAVHHNNPTPPGGVCNRGRCYNGFAQVPSYSQAADHPELDFPGTCTSGTTQDFTIDFWIRPTPAAANGVITVLDKRQQGVPVAVRGWSVYLHNGRPGFQMATGANGFNFTSPTPIADGSWHFVAIRVSPRCGPNRRGTIVVDSSIVLTFTPVVGDIDSNAPLLIGRGNSSLATAPFPGCIDELEIFKRGLTDAEVFLIRNAGNRCKCK